MFCGVDLCCCGLGVLCGCCCGLRLFNSVVVAHYIWIVWFGFAVGLGCSR